MGVSVGGRCWDISVEARVVVFTADLRTQSPQGNNTTTRERRKEGHNPRNVQTPLTGHLERGVDEFGHFNLEMPRMTEPLLPG